MKKSSVIFIGLILSLTISGAVSSADFRNVNWGMSSEQVSQAEIIATFVSEDAETGDLLYRVEIDGFKGNLIYSFKDAGLVQGKYWLPSRVGDPELQLNDFDDFVGLMRDEYGPSTSHRRDKYIYY